MDSLPSGIETYLEEAGFSGTEIAVLKKLLETDALTLRELASRTGKSTGVLDQAVKKLLKKKIIAREIINETPKYVLRSLHTVLQWMEEDSKLKQQMIVRRHENFESFIRSLTVGKKRPEMEFFEGADGIKRAYTELLNRGNDIVQYGPTTCLAEDDPLRDFRVQWFRERRNRGIFSRVLTHNTIYGRRFKSRDAFEYRKTILVDPEAYPFRFEKITIGDTVACFQLDEEQACFIKFPELAEDERLFFERIWNKKIVTDNAPPPEREPPPIITINKGVPFATKTFSQVREFFLSRRSIAALMLCVFLAAGTTYGLYRHNLSLATKRIQDKVLSIAATGVLQFDAADVEELHTLKDVAKPQYAKLIYQLNQIRNQNENVKYAYIMRPKQGSVWEFVADADANPYDPYEEADTDGDGQYTDMDENGYPGLQYDTAESSPSASEALIRPVGFGPSVDQWGTIISGWAPIHNARGETIAILGVDMEASNIQELTHQSFLPFVYFVGFLLLFIFIRLTAFNRSLFNELRDYFSTKKAFIAAIGGLVLAVAISVALYLWQVHANMEREREKILAIAVTGSLQFSADELDQLRTMQDAETPAYASVVERLQKIRSQNENIKYAYLIRPRPNTTLFSFIADADAPYPPEKRDVNGDGIIDESDEGGYPGWDYDVGHISALREARYFGPTVTEDFYTDQWGTVLSGYAPIKNSEGTVVGLLAIDVGVDAIRTFSLISIVPIIAYLVVFGVYILFIVPGYKKSLLHIFLKRIWNRKTMTITAFAMMAFYWLTFALYFYTFNLMKVEVGKRMMAIAINAAAQIDPNDLESIHFARDMKKEEYQRVFTLLNEIRDQNPDITYIYTMRATSVDGIWEFIVDADSNHFIPFDTIDYNNNGILDPADENVAPGVAYDVAFCCKQFSQFGMIKPVIELSLADQWGSTIAATAPIIKEGKVTSVIGVDKDVTKILQEGKLKSLQILLKIEIAICLLLIVISILIRRRN